MATGNSLNAFIEICIYRVTFLQQPVTKCLIKRLIFHKAGSQTGIKIPKASLTGCLSQQCCIAGQCLERFPTLPRSWTRVPALSHCQATSIQTAGCQPTLRPFTPSSCLFTVAFYFLNSHNPNVRSSHSGRRHRHGY